jgi:hypothetical protein
MSVHSRIRAAAYVVALSCAALMPTSHVVGQADKTPDPPNGAPADNKYIKNFSIIQVEKFITEKMKTDIQKTSDEKTNSITYVTPNGQFNILVRGGAAKSILFEYPHTGLNSALDKLNEWNARGGCTYAYARANGDVVLAACLDLEGGLSYGQLISFYARIQQERIVFEAFDKK